MANPMVLLVVDEDFVPLPGGMSQMNISRATAHDNGHGTYLGPCEECKALGWLDDKGRIIEISDHPGVDPACSRLAHEMLQDVCGADDDDVRLLAEAFYDVWETHCQAIEDRRSEPVDETDWGGSTLRDGLKGFTGGKPWTP